MNESFQLLFDYFKNPDKLLALNTDKIKDIIFETIGKETFCSVMDMKYARVNTTYSGRNSSENDRFYNNIWELNFFIEGDPYSTGNYIEAKDEGYYGFFNPQGKNFHILNLWLDYFKNQCKMHGIEITV